MGCLYGVPAANCSLMSWRSKIHVRAAKIIYGRDWYTPSDQVLAQSNWPTVKDLCEYRLLYVSTRLFLITFLPVPIMKLFTKYEFNSK